jgi:hypothetical protein
MGMVFIKWVHKTHKIIIIAAVLLGCPGFFSRAPFVEALRYTRQALFSV